MTDQKIRVLVVDDSAFMRSMLARMIEKDPRFEVIGKAVNGQEGVEMAEKLRPDVMTMDIEMPVMNGIQALEKIMSTVKIPVIMISTLTEKGAAITLEALEKGAFDFLPKALKDEDRNVFKSGGDLYEKLIAAAQSFRPNTFSSQKSTTFSSQTQSSFLESPVTPSLPNPLDRKVATGKKILVIGSSTGGPKALHDLFSGLTKVLPVPVVIIQHMPANFTKALANRLSDVTLMNVHELTDNEVLKPGRIYVAPGGFHTRIGISPLDKKVTFRIAEDKGESVYKPSIDVFAESVSQIFAEKTLGVMLTGMGEDGAKNFTKLHHMGAYIIGQDQETSTVYGMPRAVAESGGVSEVLPIGRIAARLLEVF